MHHASQFMISAKQLLVHNFPNTPTRHRLLNTKITADMQCIEGQIARSTLSIVGEPEKSMHTINIVSCSSSISISSIGNKSTDARLAVYSHSFHRLTANVKHPIFTLKTRIYTAVTAY
jgi:hypothetical protein